MGNIWLKLWKIFSIHYLNKTTTILNKNQGNLNKRNK